MPQLRQLHLQLALETAGTLRKNIQNQTTAIQHTAVQAAFQVPFLAGAERRTGNNELCFINLDAAPEVFNLALANEMPRVGFEPRTAQLIHNHGSGRGRQLRKLFSFVGIRCSTDTGMNQNGAFATSRSLKQS